MWLLEAADPAAAAAASAPLLPLVGRAYPLLPTLVDKQVLSLSMVEGILRRFHNDAGHPRTDALFDNIQLHTVGISRDMCEQWIVRCLDCVIKPPAPPPPRILTAIPTHRFLDHAQADCMCFVDLRTGRPVIRTVLAQVCMATKFVWLSHLTNKQHSHMKAAFRQQWLLFGAPTILQTDNGTEFKNEAMLAWLSHAQVEWRHGDPYKPSTQGVVERANRVLRHLLEILTRRENYLTTPFPDILEMVQWIMNSNWHRATKQSAYLLVFGRRPPQMMLLDMPVEPSMLSFLEEESKVEDELENPSSTAAAAAAGPPPAANAAALLRAHEDRKLAAAKNLLIYQEQWLRRENAGVTDEVFRPGQIALMRIVGQAKYKSIAAELLKQPVLVLRSAEYSKYELLTAYGILKLSVHANQLSQPPPGFETPASLNWGPEVLADQLELYETGEMKRISIDAWIEWILEDSVEVTQESVRIAVEPGRNEEEEKEGGRMVVKIKQNRTRKPQYFIENVP